MSLVARKKAEIDEVNTRVKELTQPILARYADMVKSADEQLAAIKARLEPEITDLQARIAKDSARRPQLEPTLKDYQQRVADAVKAAQVVKAQAALDRDAQLKEVAAEKAARLQTIEMIHQV